MGELIQESVFANPNSGWGEESAMLSWTYQLSQGWSTQENAIVFEHNEEHSS